MAFWRLYYHLVWATKNRQPLIRPEMESRLYPYIVSKAGELGLIVHAIGGIEDHMHLVVSIPPRHGVAYVVKCLKGASSHAMNTLLGNPDAFAWQRGYGALSLGERRLTTAISYVHHQKEHHRENTANAWVEHIVEYDEGPAMPSEDRGLALREQAPGYSVGEEAPF